MLLWCSSQYAHIWFIMYYSYIFQAREHANEICEMCGKNTCARANQNARPKWVSAVRAQQNA